jgi:23S rRNA C2498 (ribose-2'-O)-methylase RlmM
VIAVDPQPLAPALQTHAQVHWIRRPVGDVPRADLPPEVHWIAADANIAPARVIRGIRRLVPPFRRSLRGLLLTLKLNDDAVVAALPRLLQQVRELGAREVRATQLPANRRDVFVAAWMGRG